MDVGVGCGPPMTTGKHWNFFPQLSDATPRGLSAKVFFSLLCSWIFFLSRLRHLLSPLLCPEISAKFPDTAFQNREKAKGIFKHGNVGTKVPLLD